MYIPPSVALCSYLTVFSMFGHQMYQPTACSPSSLTSVSSVPPAPHPPTRQLCCSLHDLRPQTRRKRGTETAGSGWAGC
ncbi:hypothetical protein ACKVWM_011714 [Pyricularia oryzae]